MSKSTPPGQSKKQPVVPAVPPKIRWLRTIGEETFRNGDPMYVYTLQYWDTTGSGSWKTVPTFAIENGKTVELKSS